MKRAFILLFFMLGCLVIESKAQKIAVKSNLLYDATTTVNLGLEFGLARKWTLDIPVNYNPWPLASLGRTTGGALLVLRKFQPYVRRVAWTLCRL